MLLFSVITLAPRRAAYLISHASCVYFHFVLLSAKFLYSFFNKLKFSQIKDAIAAALYPKSVNILKITLPFVNARPCRGCVYLFFYKQTDFTAEALRL